MSPLCQCSGRAGGASRGCNGGAAGSETRRAERHKRCCCRSTLPPTPPPAWSQVQLGPSVLYTARPSSSAPPFKRTYVRRSIPRRARGGWPRRLGGRHAVKVWPTTQVLDGPAGSRYPMRQCAVAPLRLHPGKQGKGRRDGWGPVGVLSGWGAPPAAPCPAIFVFLLARVRELPLSDAPTSGQAEPPPEGVDTPIA